MMYSITQMDIHDKLLDMAAIDSVIIEERHAGGEELIPMDPMRWKGLELDTLFAKFSQFRQD